MIALSNSTKNGTIIFAKNSDREMNECQQIRHFPHMKRKESLVKCTYIEVPQVSETYEVILFSPYWLWGCEMGLNECGVVMGNVAVSSKEPIVGEGEGIPGMDLMRLALERGESAYDAMHVITDMIKRYPQSLYHNSFIITDPKEAWVLETAGEYWVAKKIRDIYTISNTYTIEVEWDESHPDLIKHAVEKGWCNSELDFNFAKVYGNFDKEYMRTAQLRWKRSLSLLERAKGNIDLKYMMRVMRDHGEGTLVEPRWAEDETLLNTICVHRVGETAASMIVELYNSNSVLLKSVCWALLSSPCTSVYFPLFIGIDIPEELSKGINKYDESSTWWLFEKLQRLVDKNYKALAPIVRGVWDYIEEVEMKEVRELRVRVEELLSRGIENEALRELEEYVKSNIHRITKLANELCIIVDRLSKALPSYRNLRWDLILAKSKEASLEIL